MYIDPALLQGPSGLGQPRSVQAGYNVSLTDLGGFEHALSTVQAKLEGPRVTSSEKTLQALSRPLDFVNNEGMSIAEHAQRAVEGGAELSSAEMVMLTARCQQFMFHCQLTSNIANRASDGLSQMFRQQS